MAETALNFGPDWLRALSHGSSQPSQPTMASVAAAPKYRLAEFRYGREEMLALIPKEPDLPESLKEYPHLVRDKFQVPLALTPVTEEEQRIWARSVNSDAVLRQSGKGGPSSGLSRSGRGGGSVDRGRGRGRGGFYQRGLTYEDSEDGPSTSFSRPKPIERSQSANEKDQRWDDRDRRFDRTFSGRGAGDESLSKDTPRGNNEHWRKFEKDDDPDWRTSSLRSSDKLGGRASWRNSSDKERHEAVERNLANRGASNSTRSSSHQKITGSHSWKEDMHGCHLPEWSVEEGSEHDMVGTFDSSGAFLETKLAESSLDEVYDSDDADEGLTKDSPEAKPDHSKKTPKKSPSSSSVKQKVAKSKITELKDEKLMKAHLPQKASEPCMTNHKKTIDSSIDNVIKQSAIVEQCHVVSKNPDYNPVTLPNVPDVAKSTKTDNAILSNARASEASAPSTSIEEDAFAHHKKATENMVAQWTEEEEQHISVIAQSPDAHSSHQEKDIKWFYQDPQGEIQGPFTSSEMLEWFSAGYFTMSLMVRRGCDKKFLQLGELIKSWGRVPFMPGSSPPPVHSAALTASLPTPITQTIVPPNPVSAPTVAQMPKQDDQYMALQHQLLQQQIMQQQLLLRQAQLQQLVAQFKQQDNFASLPQQQQQVMLQQFMAQQQIPRPYIAPMAEKAGIETLTPLPLHVLGLAPMPTPMMKNDLSMWNVAPGPAGTWPHKANTAQPSSISIWDVDMDKVNSEDSDSEKKRTAEEEETARKDEEIRLQQERELEENRKLEELRRKQEEERILIELQKQEEERRRLEEQKMEEERRLEEQRKLEEQQKLEEQRKKEEQRRKEEQKRLDEIKRQEEQMRLEELKRQEEQKRMEELKRREEQRRQEELRRQEEQQKLEERQKKEEQQRKMEREKQLEFERQKEMQRQKETEEKIQREREKQREREREEMELRRIAELKKTQGPAWGVRNMEDSGQLSLADIQRLQEEKEREEREEKLRIQLLQQQAVKQVQQSKNNLSWAKRSVEVQHTVKSLAEIQQEEAERLAQLQRNQKPQTPAPVVNANVGVWGNTSHLSKITAAPQSWSASAPTSGFWDDALSSTQTRKQPTKSNDSAFPALAIPTQPAVVSSSKSKNVRAKREEDVVTRLFNSHRKPTDEFTKWCTEAISSMPSSVDVPTFVAFLKDIESPYEVYDYVKSYLGEGKEPREFAKQFLERRSKYRNQAKQSPSEENTLWGPAPAITPSVNKTTTMISIDCDGSAKGKAKKKKNRMQKLDNSMLGFTVQSNPDRLNVGEIDHVEGM